MSKLTIQWHVTVQGKQYTTHLIYFYNQFDIYDSIKFLLIFGYDIFLCIFYDYYSVSYISKQKQSNQVLTII